jgi:hypothetical protein
MTNTEREALKQKLARTISSAHLQVRLIKEDADAFIESPYSWETAEECQDGIDSLANEGGLIERAEYLARLLQKARDIAKQLKDAQ